jgi:ABC-type sugar transport system ATPase subunit/ribose/xylose/arabinose/galactoside ABC-type transport system permease subunit
MTSPILSLDDVCKAFGGVPALRDARLEVRPGEVQGLVGENGAGKSTLINIATGVLQPDSGTLTLNGAPIQVHSPRHAASLGIAVVHQEADLFPQLSIAENMLLGRGLNRGTAGFVNWNRTNAEGERLVQAMGESFDVRAPAAGLSVARRMMAEIAAAVSEDARVLFLDEPTASLTLKEIERLFAQVRSLRDAGVGIVYVSHRLEEILALCDRATIMRDGATLSTHPTSTLTMDRIVAEMVGRDATDMYAARKSSPGEVVCKVEGLADKAGAFQEISLEVRAGEITGLYGFVGAGRSELGQALFGLRPTQTGTVCIDDKPVKARSPREALRHGIAYLPEDRLVQGVFRGHSIRTNASVALLRRLSWGPLVRRRAENDLAERVMDTTQVRAQSIRQAIGTLSGGNQQKVVFGRWHATTPKLLILDEPTRGVDVGAKAELHKLIAETAESGAAILVISSELPEIMGISDRVLTMAEGRLTGDFDPKQDDEATVAAAAVPTTGEGGRKRDARKRSNPLLVFREVGLLGFILLLSLGMTIAQPGAFANATNFFDVLAYAAIPAIVGMGAMLIICGGGIDISVGAMMGLVATVATLAAQKGVPAPACMGIAIGLGAALSMVNAGISLLARIHPIIVTLAGISIYRGITQLITGGYEIVGLPAGYRALADGRLFGIPKVCYYVVVITIVAHLLLRYRLIGRQLLALGNSESAARLIGFSKPKLTLFSFAASGALVGVAAVLYAGYYGKVQTNTGTGMELMAIAAAVIGGTNILGGRGSAIGTLLGAFLVALLYNILVLTKANAYWESIFVGGLILLAVVLDASLQRTRRAQT